MPEVIFEAPLKVPAAIQLTPRTKKRFDSGFSPTLSIDEALRYLQEEVAQFPEGAHFTIFSNYERLNDSKMRKRLSDECAVCCELGLGADRYYFVSHLWGLTEQNIYAIHLTLRAIHNIVRWGLADYETLLAAFRPRGGTQQEAIGHTPVNEADLVSRGQWLAILRLQESSTLEEANEAYRFYAKKAANSEEGLLRLNQAIAAAREYFAKRG